MGLLDKKALLEKEKLQVEKVDLGNDNYVYVRQMTAHDRDVWERSILREKRNSKGQLETYETVLEDFRAKLAVITICDEEGNLILDQKDYPTLSRNISAARLEKIINAAQKLNAISEQDKEDLLKNSVVGQADNSSSDSAKN